MPRPQLASVSALLPGGPRAGPRGLGEGRAGGAAAISAGPRHVPGRRAGRGREGERGAAGQRGEGGWVRKAEEGVCVRMWWVWAGEKVRARRGEE